MSGEWSDFALPAAIGVSVVAALHGGMAYACLKRRAPLFYVTCVVSLWVATSIVLGHPSVVHSHTLLQKPDLPNMLDSLASLAPAAIVPGVFLFPAVKGFTSAKWIPALALLGSLLALPLAIGASLYGSCYILHDCL